MKQLRPPKNQILSTQEKKKKKIKHESEVTLKWATPNPLTTEVRENEFSQTKIVFFCWFWHLLGPLEIEKNKEREDEQKKNGKTKEKKKMEKQRTEERKRKNKKHRKMKKRENEKMKKRQNEKMNKTQEK